MSLFSRKARSSNQQSETGFHLLSDAELYAKLKGEKISADAAFTTLYFRHAQRIYGYCRCILGNDHSAQEILQETFVRFYQTRKAAREMTNIAAYLLTISRNLCLNHKRTSGRSVPLDEVHVTMPPPSIERGELLDLIIMSMELLPDDLREAFFLREFEQLPYAEIAEILNASPGTIRVRVTRARHRIREILTPYVVELNQE